MLDALSHLALEVKYVDRARAFYEETLGFQRARAGSQGHGYEVGETTLVLRPPGEVPRGGLHVHFAMRTTDEAYDDWLDRVAGADLDPEEFDFGAYRSLYVDDPDDHCVEVGSGGDPAGVEASHDPENARAHDLPLTGLFEVVLEVESLSAAEERYRALGFEPVDRGSDRRRVRLRGPMDLELWEPQLGIADARGGVHVHLGFAVADPATAADAFDDWTAERVTHGEGTSVVGGHVDPPGVSVRDPDGHWLTFHEPRDGD
jgi:catechol-2,3-dioxygenase